MNWMKIKGHACYVYENETAVYSISRHKRVYSLTISRFDNAHYVYISNIATLKDAKQRAEQITFKNKILQLRSVL